MMNSKNHILFFKNVKKGTFFVVGVLLLVAFFVLPTNAAVSPSFNAKNQAGMPLNDGGSYAANDLLFFNDTSIIGPNDGEILLWNWTFKSDFGFSQILKNNDKDRNISFNPTSSSTLTANLSVVTSKGVISDNFTNTYTLSDCNLISANYSSFPAYDNRTSVNPNGTITFWDSSFHEKYPLEDVTNWWWHATYGHGISDNYTGVNHITLPLINSTYSINLTVGDRSGCLVSYNGTTDVHPVIPISNFTVVPMTGNWPLELSVIDQSYSYLNYTRIEFPLNYEYILGNITEPVINKFYTKNFNTTIYYPGNYTLTQIVNNSFGEKSNSKINNITVGQPFSPVANFTYLKVDNQPLTLQFIDQSFSTTPLTYNWSFDNQYFSNRNEKSPQHTFQTNGTYKVNLTVTDENKQSNKIEKEIIVQPMYPPVPEFKHEANVGNTMLISFKDTSNGYPSSWKWAFGDGFGSSAQSPDHFYAKSGSYTVNLTVSNSAGSRQIQKIITVL